MRKILLTFAFGLFFTGIASAQFMPSFQAGIKAGSNYSVFPSYGDYKNVGQAGYIGGIWARIGALGFNFQPEMYVTSRDVNVTYEPAGQKSTVAPSKFTSLDIPLLLGTKIGDADLGGRFYGGPVISYGINTDNTFNPNVGIASRLDVNDQNYSVQLGAGIDIDKFSIDLRYEAGLNKIAYGPSEYSHTRLDLFNLTLAYSLMSFY